MGRKSTKENKETIYQRYREQNDLTREGGRTSGHRLRGPDRADLKTRNRFLTRRT